MDHYAFSPSTVARTILLQRGPDQPHAQSAGSPSISDGGSADTIITVGKTTSPLFTLHWGQAATLSSPFGQAKLDRAEVEQAEADPLWESAHSICSHMDEDHADTFATFLGSVGRPELKATGMPWVESAGFFLATDADYVFIPFPTPCLDANSVRTTLIKMLRGARAANG